MALLYLALKRFNAGPISSFSLFFQEYIYAYILGFSTGFQKIISEYPEQSFILQVIGQGIPINIWFIIPIAALFMLHKVLPNSATALLFAACFGLAGWFVVTTVRDVFAVEAVVVSSADLGPSCRINCTAVEVMNGLEERLNTKLFVSAFQLFQTGYYLSLRIDNSSDMVDTGRAQVFTTDKSKEFSRYYVVSSHRKVQHVLQKTYLLIEVPRILAEKVLGGQAPTQGNVLHGRLSDGTKVETMPALRKQYENLRSLLFKVSRIDLRDTSK